MIWQTDTFHSPTLESWSDHYHKHRNNPMKFYIAARFGRREECFALAKYPD